MPLPQSPDYQEMQQGVDRITSILTQQSQPRQSMNLEPSASPLSPNMLNLVQSAATSYGVGNRPPSFLDVLTKTQESMQRQQYGAQDQLMQAYEAKLKLGDRQTKALDDKIQMFVGDDPEAKSIILQELHNLPDDIDPTSTDAYIKIAGIAKKHGLTNVERQLKLSGEQAKIDLLGAQTSATKALGQQRQTTGVKPKPMPAAALKMQNEALDILGTARNTQADLGNVINAIENGTLDLGLMSNIISSGRNYLGLSSEESRNYQTFRNTLEKLRNDSLRLNKGVQTEGDAVRAWNEIVTNINDPELVKQRLKEVQQINDRAANLKMMEVDQIRQNYGAEPIDYSSYESKPAILTENEPMTELPDPAQHSGRTITNTDTGQKYKSNGSEWIPQ